MQPQKYERITDFTEREGDDTDHSALNDEFDAAALTTDQIRANLALIQRDDGALKNGIVTADALAPSAFDAVQASVNEATAEAEAAALSALTSATTANTAKDAAVVAKTQAETARDSSNLNAANAAASAAAALASKNSATASEAAALVSKNAAAASETAAAASQASATGSAATATAQAGIATTKASEALASQVAAAASASTASTKASEANTSAGNAASSATTAGTQAGIAITKATEASSSASAAATSASTATTKADSATASATAAASSAATATTKAAEASGSATAAAGSATSAATSATNAASSATSAASSASDANTSAVSAASSAASAAALLDNFDDRYLGAKSSAPSLDNDGNALVLGALYFDSTTGKMRVYTASGWLDASSASVATLAVFNYTATASQTSFSGADIASQTLTYTVGSLFVTLNGIDLKNGTDYTATTGSSIVLASGAAAGDELRVYAFGSFLVADTYTRAEIDTFVAAKVSKTGAETVAGVKTFSNQPVFSSGIDLSSNGQIKFPASQNASADANTLDDYEEGTWTPTFTANGSNPTYVLGATVAKYVKIGKLVNFTISMQWNSLSGGSGALQISLPFTTHNDSQGFQGNYQIGYSAGLVGTPKGGYNDPNNAFFFMVKDATGGTLIAIPDVASGGHIICGGSYLVA